MSTTVPSGEALMDRVPSQLSAAAEVFDLGDRLVSLSFTPDGWLTAHIDVHGCPESLLATQATILSAAKIAKGPTLRVELPVARSAAPPVSALWRALEVGLAALDGRERTIRGPAREADEAARVVLATYAASAYGWEWATDPNGWRCLAETRRRTHRIDVRMHDGHVSFRTTIARPRDPAPASRRALSHFLLELNARLRLARGALADAGVRLEVILPASDLDLGLIDHVLGALVVGASRAGRECAALLDLAMAREYCAFHEVTIHEEGR